MPWEGLLRIQASGILSGGLAKGAEGSPLARLGAIGLDAGVVTAGCDGRVCRGWPETPRASAPPATHGARRNIISKGSVKPQDSSEPSPEQQQEPAVAEHPQLAVGAAAVAAAAAANTDAGACSR